MKDYYDVLGVPKTASKEEIKRAYRILAFQYHPDKNNGKDKKFKEINEAYRILSGDDTRSEYDRTFKTKSYRSNSTDSTSTTTEKSDFWENGGAGIIVIIGIIIVRALFSGADSKVETSNLDSSSNNRSVSAESAPPSCIEGMVLNSSKKACITRVAYCSQNWKNSVWDGSKCTCTGNYQWNPGQTACVTAYEYCPQKFSNSIYDQSTNTCTCKSGYVWNSNQSACLDPVAARNDSCNASYPNSEYLKPNPNTGGSICDCKSGYFWNSLRTACYSQTSFNQSCQSSFGYGSYAVTQNGGMVCDCSYGYSWNADRKACVTTASINEICVRDVGRNSYYTGTATNGKYNCSAPY